MNCNRIKICAVTASIRKYEQLIKKKTKKNGKIVFLEKNMLNRIEVLSSKVLIDSYISRDEFVLLNNILKEYDVEEKIKI